MVQRFFVLSIIAALAAVPARAQDGQVELTGFYGYRFSGGFGGVDIADGDSLGLILGIPVGWDTHLEILYGEQSSTVRRSGRDLFDMDVEYYHVGGRRTFDDDDHGPRPFTAFSLGVTRYRPEPGDVSSESRFSFGLGGGVLVPVGNHLGIRLEGRAWGTFLNAGGGIWCSPFGCAVTAGGDVAWQVEGLAGLTIRF